MISTPSHLTAYLAALAAQIPDVMHVITGEGSRQEGSTNATARYPQILIETPEAFMPAGGDQKGLSTSIYVLAMPAGTSHAKEDLASDRAYRVAEMYISAIRAHALSEDYGFTLAHDGVTIEPRIAKSSDQVRGWVFDLDILVDQHCSDFDPESFFMPQFRVAVSGDPGAPTISITDTSIGTPDYQMMWWREEIAGALQTVNELAGDEITLPPTDPVSTYRIVHIWMRMTSPGVSLWSYARVHSGDTGGISLPFIPHYPV